MEVEAEVVVEVVVEVVEGSDGIEGVGFLMAIRPCTESYLTFSNVGCGTV